MERLKKCDCGFANGWYHRGKDSSHEYNPFVSEEQATHKFHETRKPPGCFYHHISGPYVAAEVKGEKTKTFKYKDYESEQAACRAAALWIFKKVQPSFF